VYGDISVGPLNRGRSIVLYTFLVSVKDDGCKGDCHRARDSSRVSVFKNDRKSDSAYAVKRRRDSSPFSLTTDRIVQLRTFFYSLARSTGRVRGHSGPKRVPL